MGLVFHQNVENQFDLYALILSFVFLEYTYTKQYSALSYIHEGFSLYLSFSLSLSVIHSALIHLPLAHFMGVVFHQNVEKSVWPICINIVFCICWAHLYETIRCIILYPRGFFCISLCLSLPLCSDQSINLSIYLSILSLPVCGLSLIHSASYPSPCGTVRSFIASSKKFKS